MRSERPWIGLDVGERRIGVAVSDELGWFAQPYSVIERKGLTADVESLVQLAGDCNAQGFVVGLPRRTTGEAGPEVEYVRAFVAALQQQTSLPIEWYDERFSTVVAERALREQGVRGAKRRRRIDQVAAAVILQDFLDRRRHNGRG